MASLAELRHPIPAASEGYPSREVVERLVRSALQEAPVDSHDDELNDEEQAVLTRLVVELLIAGRMKSWTEGALNSKINRFVRQIEKRW